MRPLMTALSLTPAAETTQGGATQMQNWIEGMVLRTNMAFRNGGFINSTLVNVATDQYQIPGLLPAHTTYYWRVRSVNITGQASL